MNIKRIGLISTIVLLCLSVLSINSFSQTTPITSPNNSTTPPPNTNGTNNPNGDKNQNEINKTTLIEEYTENMDIVKSEELKLDKQDKIDGLVVFGSEIFSKKFQGTTELLNQPPPYNYLLGPNDVIRINVTGKSLVSWEPTIQADGSIFLEGSGIGKIYVGGKNIETATETIRNTLRTYNYAIGNGTFVDVSLVSMRSFNINIVGEVVQPGSKTVTSFTSVLDALYLCGGITLNGSYRYIQVIRDNRIFAEVDLYDMLIDGDFTNNIYLQNNDIIRVPVYKSRIGIYGEVKRNALFEIKPGETLRDILKFAGGFTEYAYSSIIKVRQVTDTEIRLRDIHFNDYERYIPFNGDRYTVDKILDRVENRVSVQGMVFRPGDFELETTGTILQLIEKAGGLREEAFLNRAYLTRTNPIDNRMENIPIDLQGILSGKKENIILQREDVLYVLSIYDITDSSTISVVGKVREPGTFSYYPGITIEDAILKANGFSDGADFMNVKIARMIKNSDRKSASAQVAEIIDVTLDPYLTVSDKNIKLEPYDVVYIYPYTGFSKPITVSIEGEVLVPGEYPMTYKNNRISDLINRAGGLNELANIKGATLYRINYANTENEKEIEKYKKYNRDVTNFSSMVESGDTSTKIQSKIVNNETVLDPNIIPINLPYILKNPGSPQDLILQEGDRLSIPVLTQTITIKGNVGMPTITLYVPGKSLISYINNDAGGFSDVGYKRKTQVYYPNGRVKVKRLFGGFPKIEPGCEIYVPYRKPKERTGFNYQSIIAMTSSLSSTAAIVFAIIRMNKN